MSKLVQGSKRRYDDELDYNDEDTTNHQDNTTCLQSSTNRDQRVSWETIL